MNTLPFQFLLMTMAGWVNRNQEVRGRVECRERLDGVLKYYHRLAA